MKTLIYPHQDKENFIEAIRSSAGETGFSEILIEKDYFCSLILREIFTKHTHSLIFKGGTLLNKTHAGFYRLSEDLDFSIDAEPKISRKKRSHLVSPAKEHLLKITKTLSLKSSKEIRGNNENKQYNGEIEYNSLMLGGKSTVKIEIGVRERVLEIEKLIAKTLARNPFSKEPLISNFEIIGLSLHEAYAEKIRAALSRKTPAIRDIFDLDYALKKQLLNIKKIKPLVKQKFELEDIKVNLNSDRKKILKDQIFTDLRPVLRETDFKSFDFENAWENIIKLYNSLKL